MTALAGALRLRRIAAALREGRQIDPADAVPLGIALDEILAGQDAKKALGIADTRGGISHRKALALADRDEALEQLATLVYGEIGGENSEGVWNIFDCLNDYFDVEDDEKRAEMERLAEIVKSLSRGGTLSRKQIARLLAHCRTFNSDWMS